MEKLITASGLEFDCDMVSVIPSPPRCYLHIRNTPLATIVSVFSNPGETEQLWHGGNYISGFTKLQAISDDDGAYRVTLRKG